MNIKNANRKGDYIKTILAIDPGNVESGYTLIEVKTQKPIRHGKIKNEELEELMLNEFEYDHLVLEMVASYGMSVGQSVFDTVFHTGRFSNIKPHIPYSQVYRRDVKMHLLGKSAVKDTHITQLLVHRFTTPDERKEWGDYGKGVKANQGFFYGFNNDIYQSFAVGITWLDVTKNGKLNFQENKKNK